MTNKRECPWFSNKDSMQWLKTDSPWVCDTFNAAVLALNKSGETTLCANSSKATHSRP